MRRTLLQAAALVLVGTLMGQGLARLLPQPESGAPVCCDVSPVVSP